MTLLFTESFGVDMNKWDTNFASRITSPLGRYGDTGIAQYNDQGFWSIKNITASAQVFAGGAFFTTGAGNGLGRGLSFWGDGGATEHLRLWQTSGTVLTLFRADGTSLGTATLPTTINTWYYLEMSGTIADSGGTCVVRINGGTVINFTGDTKNGGTSTNIDAVRYGSIGGSVAYWDDIYICNSSGSVNNTFLGEIRVQALLPTGTGSSTQLTPTGSANNWDNVNDIPGVDTTYNGSPTAAQRDTYALADTTLVGAVAGVQVVSRMRKSDAGAASMKAAVKSGATVAYGTTRTLTATATTYIDQMETDPNTSAAWTTTNVNALELGAEVA